MSFSRHEQIYRSDVGSAPDGGEAIFRSAPNPIIAMSLQLDIPWRVGLHQSPPPLHQPAPCSITGCKL